MLNVPGSTHPSDEFLAPTGQWLSVYRAITYDGWMLWKDALPVDRLMRQRLDAHSYDNICLLGKRIHLLHQAVDDVRRIGESPFTVSRWWDPLADPIAENGEHWHLGRHVLFRMKNMTAKQFTAIPQRRSQLQFRIVSTNWIEASLPPEASKGLPLVSALRPASKT